MRAIDMGATTFMVKLIYTHSTRTQINITKAS